MSKKVSYSKRQISHARSNAGQREMWANYFEARGEKTQAAIQRKKAAQFRKGIQTMKWKSCHDREINE